MGVVWCGRVVVRALVHCVSGPQYLPGEQRVCDGGNNGCEGGGGGTQWSTTKQENETGRTGLFGVCVGWVDGCGVWLSVEKQSVLKGQAQCE